jgi:hypothetical protein
MQLEITNSRHRWRRLLSPRNLFALALISFIAAISPTLAANISINAGDSAEFGQGILATSTCDSYLMMVPKPVLQNDVFYLDTLEIKDISSLNHDNSFTIQIYTETGTTGLLATPAVIQVGSDGISFTKTSSGDNTTLETITANTSTPGGGAKAEPGTSSIRLKSITTDGVTKIRAQDAMKFTLQTSGSGSCSRVYALGDTGPAGGTIAILPTTAGNSTGKYFEIGVPSPSSLPWCGSSDAGFSTLLGTGTTIGTGAANTAKIAASCSEGTGVYADQYSLGGYNDWFLPSAYELNAVKDIAPSGSYATSSERGSGSLWYQNIPAGQPVLNDHAPKGFSLRSLPMRSFSAN